MDFLQDPAFWWAVLASVWAVASDYLAANPRIKANGVSQLLISTIGSIIRQKAMSSGRERRRRNRRG
jgi:predicted signal transduction protein with EAL and GGDEF domain